MSLYHDITLSVNQLYQLHTDTFPWVENIFDAGLFNNEPFA